MQPQEERSEDEDDRENEGSETSKQMMRSAVGRHTSAMWAFCHELINNGFPQSTQGFVAITTSIHRHD